MSSEFLNYLKRIDSYKENKIHQLQSATIKMLSGKIGGHNRVDLLSKISESTDSSTAHTQYVVNNMTCVKAHDLVLELNPAIGQNMGGHIIPAVCGDCPFGPEGTIRSGCNMLLNRYYRDRRDIRLTTYDDENGVATHYGIDRAKDARTLAMSITPSIEQAILEHVHKSRFEQEDNLWEDILANHLRPLMRRDIGGAIDKLGVNQNNYDFLSNFRTILKVKYSSIPKNITQSPWLPVIREFGIFTVVSDFVNKVYSKMRHNSKGFKDSNQILDFHKDYFYPINEGTTYKRGDRFRMHHVVRHKGKPISTDVICPGRAIGSALSLCLLFNLDLKKKNLYTSSNNRINLITFDKENNPHLLYPSQMKQQYDDLIDFFREEW